MSRWIKLAPFALAWTFASLGCTTTEEQAPTSPC